MCRLTGMIAAIVIALSTVLAISSSSAQIKRPGKMVYRLPTPTMFLQKVKSTSIVFEVEMKRKCKESSFLYHASAEVVLKSGEIKRESIQYFTREYPKERRMEFNYSGGDIGVSGLRGSVDLINSGQGAIVEFEKPEKRVKRIRSEALLESEYAEILLKALMENRTKISTLLVDPESESGMVKQLDTVIPGEVDRRLAKFDPRLTKMKAWRLRSSMVDIPESAAEDSAGLTIEQTVYADGTVDLLFIRYKALEFTTELVSYRPYAQPDCPA